MGKKVAPLNLRGFMDHLARMKSAGRHVIYLGDATISCWALEPIVEMFEETRRLKLEGHLGMGNPSPPVGLRWVGVSDSMMLDSRKLYREKLLPKV